MGDRDVHRTAAMHAFPPSVVPSNNGNCLPVAAAAKGLLLDR